MEKLIVRVYGVCMNSCGDLLIADEVHRGLAITKFPGGGLELGEGPIDCLKREFLEESGKAISILRHFYTTDFCVQSYFDAKTQILSIYYLVEFAEHSDQNSAVPSLDPEVSFRWQPLAEFNEEQFTFVVDKRVAEMILAELGPMQ